MQTLTVCLYDGERQPFRQGKVLLHLRKGDQTLLSRYVDDERVDLNLDMEEPRPLAVIASRSGFRQCGFFLPLTEPLPNQVHLMLVPNAESLSFPRNLRDQVLARQPDYKSLLESDPNSKDQMEAFRLTNPKELACLLNILEAIRWLPNATAIIAALQQIQIHVRTVQEEQNRQWTGLQPDRAFVIAQDTLIAQLKDQTVFSDAPPTLHPPADQGYKESGRFGEANLNFTIISKPSDLGPGLIRADIDLDYYDDKLAHIALEVIPNSLSKLFGKRHLTNPAQVFALRWMATKNFQGNSLPVGETGPRPDFNPLFTLTAG